MSTTARFIRTDENNLVHQGKAQTKKVLGARPALGDVGNKIQKPADLQKENILRDAKQPSGVYKNIKARVDTGLKTVTTRADTRKAQANSSNNFSNVFVSAKTQAVPRVAVPKNTVTVKVSELPKVQTVKREDSQIDKRTLNKVKNAIRKDSSTEKLTALKKSVIPTHSTQLIQQIEDIDAHDTTNPQLVAEYVNDIYSYLFQLERDFAIKQNYLSNQKEVTPKMRHILIDWINEVHLQFKLEIETFHMAVSIIDRFLQTVSNTSRKELQLVGVTSLFLASKYEELYPPEITDFVYITDDTYSKKQILDMEKFIFKALDFHLGKPLPIHFLRRYSKAAKGDDINHILAKYLLELAAVEYNMCHYHPSEIAAAAVYLSLKLFQKSQKNNDTPTWTPTLIHYSKYTALELRPIVIELAKTLQNASNPNTKLNSVFNKYSSSKFNKISLHPNVAHNNKLLEQIINS